MRNHIRTICQLYRMHGTERPSQALVSQVVREVSQSHSDMSDFGRFEMACRTLRKQYGFEIPQDRIADQQEERTARVALDVLADSKINRR